MLEFYLITYAIIILIGRFISRTQRKKTDLKEQLQGILRDPTAIMMVFTTLISFTLPVVEAVLRRTIKFNILSFSNGILLIGLGWALSYFANQDIAENWSPAIMNYGDQFLVTRGTYQVVRHPLYLAGLLIFVGTQIYLQNTWSWILLLLMVPTIIIRISLEEMRLIKKFGRNYQEYQQRTKALIPWVW
jgi:protein-S-isoprenylcysteine O-methyltransferase Ste14